mmetsp:Transcript_64467/g.72197  ORF Transcript_64467/g.72197 Transcript_64467/m.72197 type:complete len:198 (+) Transcript_64467:194-787(+)
MKSFQSILLLLAMTIVTVHHDHQCSAFTTPTLLSSSLSSTTSQSIASTQLNMGLFDRFTQSPEERAAAEAEKVKIKKAKEVAKRLEEQEQMRLQKEIIDRRRNPEKMDEYHALKQERRNLRLEGDDEGAANLAAKIFENVDDTAQSVSFAKTTATPTPAADTSSTTTTTTTKSEDAEEEVDLKSEYSKEMLKKYKLM